MYSWWSINLPCGWSAYHFLRRQLSRQLGQQWITSFQGLVSPSRSTRIKWETLNLSCSENFVRPSRSIKPERPHIGHLLMARWSAIIEPWWMLSGALLARNRTSGTSICSRSQAPYELQWTLRQVSLQIVSCWGGKWICRPIWCSLWQGRNLKIQVTMWGSWQLICRRLMKWQGPIWRLPLRMKRDYDLRILERNYEVGDVVHILDTASVKGQCKKFRPP